MIWSANNVDCPPQLLFLLLGYVLVSFGFGFGPNQT